LDTKTDIICSAGMEMRDYPTLIRALKPLNIPCHIATGEARGKLFDTVKKLYAMNDIPSHITIGAKNKEELRQLYARSRFVVVPLLPTDTDNGLTVILEAMAMGKPVICSKVEGQIDVIHDNVTGIYVPQGDPKALRKAIKDLWNNPERAEKMGRAARRHIEKYHTLEQFVKTIKQEVFKTLIKKDTHTGKV
jgi:glycosyltransferase involved in cell wall biosynthesis